MRTKLVAHVLINLFLKSQDWDFRFSLKGRLKSQKQRLYTPMPRAAVK